MKNKFLVSSFLSIIVLFVFTGVVLHSAPQINEASAALPTGTDDTVEEASQVYQGEEIVEYALYLFFSPTCPHCRKEREFLKNIHEKYPKLLVFEYDVAIKENVVLLRELAERNGAEHLIGTVPLTFIGEYYISGYDTDKTTGKDIERTIEAVRDGVPKDEKKMSFDMPFVGKVYAEDFSLPILAILLGFLDGFNVCSLGALMLIIGLTLKLQRRRTIILLGGTFIATTAIIYGALIVLWYKLFEHLNQYIDHVKIVVILLAFGGGLYFLKEYFRMRKQGAMCELEESKLINRLMERTGKAIEDNTKLLSLIGVVFTFATVVAVVEFPCSAATPVLFAQILAEAGLHGLGYLSHIALFVLFYMLDEILIFGIAAYRLKLWMTNGSFTKYAVLAEAIILLAIGVIYLDAVVGFLAPMKAFLGF